MKKESGIIVVMVFASFVSLWQGICLAGEVTTAEELFIKCDNVLFGGEINLETVNLASWVKVNCLDRNIQTKISIASPGGEVNLAIATFNLLRLSKKPEKLETVAIGGIESAAVIVYLAGDNRLIASNAHIMLHPVRRSTGGYQTLNDMELSITLLKEVIEQEVGIIASRTKLSPQKVRDMMEKQTVLSAEEAVRLGFADSILQVK